ncbi:MAG: glycosyltransferase family 2 protein [Actinobacteria bacterium]|nr:MAG: glycosyltransferase family 2 protein [Actinomycetota bacterium]
MGQRPSVSVVITTYNQASYIGAALESVFAQTLPPDEVIVVDDGSMDDTPGRIAPYRDRLVYIRQANQGIAASRNAAIRQAQGELLAFLDGDDIWDPEKLACQVAAAVAHPRAGLIAVNGVQFSDTGLTRESLFPPPIASLFRDGEECVSLDSYRTFLRGNVVGTTSQVMIPARTFETVGLSDPSLALVSDWDLYLRIAEEYPVTFVARRLTRWRFHEGSASGPAKMRELRWGEDGVYMLAKHVRRAPIEHREFVRTALESKIFTTAQAAYYCAIADQRGLGLRVLWRLLRWSRVSAAPVTFLIAALSPAWLRRFLGRITRRVLRVRRLV